MSKESTLQTKKAVNLDSHLPTKVSKEHLDQTPEPHIVLNMLHYPPPKQCLCLNKTLEDFLS